MAAHRPTILGSALPFFRVYLDAQRRHGDEPLFPDLRTCTAGGAPTPPELVRELVEGFGIRGVVQSWGLTEFPVATAARPDDPPQVLVDTIGKPTPGVSLRVVDGELRVKGAQCFLGYVDPALDLEAFDEDGWFRTGDLGFVDDDGNVHITGRLKDIIIRNAENISAAEIEDVLLRHPDIADVAVIGVPDARTGERVVAVVVPEPGATVTMETVAAHCRALELARQKTPEQLELVDALPRNPMGKVLKQSLKDSLSAV
jgi:acyl-CoA synthetase (AMP-forming)/AMP-acid ligase II